MMTKKHYAAIAKIIDETSVPISDIGSNIRHLIPRDRLIDRLADYFESENGRFDATRFREACTRT